MGVTYQTSNRQRRKVMTAPLNAPPMGLACIETAAAATCPVAPASRPDRPRRLWLTMVGIGVVMAVAAARAAL